MSMRVLVDPRGSPVAKLILDQEVEIFEDWLKKKVEISGITVDKEFKNKYKTGWRVYPRDDKAIFAKAFSQFLYVHGLQQQGFKWKGPEALKVLEMRNWSDLELAHYVIGLHKEEIERKRNAFPPEGLPSNKRTKSEDSRPSSEY